MTAYRRHSMGGGFMDWANQPWPFKRYPYAATQALDEPRPLQSEFWPTLLAWPPPPDPDAPPLDSAGLAGLLSLAAGLTAQGQSGTFLRSPASAGGLYPAELYFSASGLEWLEDGLWHYAPEAGAPRLLRPGNLAGASAETLGGEPRELNFFITALLWRSIWKYHTRAWRYCLLDGGHLLACLELALAACGLEQRLCLDPAAAGGKLLGLTPEREALLTGVSAGAALDHSGPDQLPAWQPPREEPLSAREQSDPDILAAAALGQSEAPGPALEWPDQPAPRGAIRLSPAPPEEGPSLGRVMQARRSRRNFMPQGLSAGHTALLLAAALPEAGPLRATVLLGAGGEVPAGVYGYHPGKKTLSMQEPQDRRIRAARACLDQAWVGRAALNLVLWADPKQLSAVAGKRGYRLAMLAAGRAGQRLYLAATALGMGCCGVGAFYDDEVAAAAELPAGAWPLYLLAAGPVKGGPQI
ncbi:MAG: nitroreductase family protein [Desulfarculaceae bacterium]|nr:nitroreductase family protein [Desulfarculaceae bacterium]MCF8046727.1 nitroreductase family protein [Desulfarculaceae bacterium]MCF8096983.1 nitroreductase family protein [Desulfarculaceae bacterium]MCF8122534.1 nitroreductase family protein [Desulfarculaceae bacterium]